MLFAGNKIKVHLTLNFTKFSQYPEPTKICNTILFLCRKIKFGYSLLRKYLNYLCYSLTPGSFNFLEKDRLATTILHYNNIYTLDGISTFLLRGPYNFWAKFGTSDHSEFWDVLV